MSRRRAIVLAAAVASVAIAGVPFALRAPRPIMPSERTSMTPRKVNKTEEEWKQQLTPEQFFVARKKGTERSFTGEYWDCHAEGTYHCACCGAELFRSADKYDSGTGWPSYSRPIRPDAVDTEEDRSFQMTRTEALCNACGAHLGHVFEDGPGPAGLRYCMNSASLKLVPPAEKGDEAK